LPKLLSAHLAVRNAVLLDYPAKETCLSVLPFVDELVIVCERTGDGTEDLLEDLRKVAPEKVRLVYETWWNKARGPQCIADAQNRAIELCEGTYHLQMQADEVYHEHQLERLVAAASKGSFDCAVFSKLNFWASFQTVIRTPRVPKEVTWIGRRSLYPGLRSVSDGFSLGCPEGNLKGLRSLDLRGQVQSFHYGYVRKPAALVEKFRHMMDDLYGWGVPKPLTKGLETGRIAWTDLVPSSEVEPFTGTHPASMATWIAERREMVEQGICLK